MTIAPRTFDPIKFKQTTRAQWQEAADAWHRWGPLLNKWLGPATEQMFDMGAMGPGSRVLDVAAGAGEQSIAAARRVGPTGHVLATDLSSNILELALESARLAGLDNVEIRELDGEHVDELGKLAVMSYSTGDKNEFFSLPVSIIRERAELPPPLPGQPGPFSLGDPSVMEQLLVDGGYRDIEVRTVDAPVRVESACECLRFERESFGALHQMLSSLPEFERDSVWDEIGEALQRFEGADGFVGPCELIIAGGTK